MFNDYSAIEKNFQTTDKKIMQKNDAGRSLNIYINQLKFHFELTDGDILNILIAIIKKRRKTSGKNWWHIWK